MLPADQGFGAQHLTGAHVDLRLVIKQKLPIGKCILYAVKSFVTGAQRTILLRIENVISILAGLLGTIHSLICLPQQLVGVDIFALRVVAHTDTRAHLALCVTNRYGLCSHLDQAIENRYADGNIRQVEQNSDKLITTKTGQGIVFAQHLRHTPGQDGQQFVADCVAVLVVDLLESIQIDKDNRQVHATPTCLTNGMLKAVSKQ